MNGSGKVKNRVISAIIMLLIIIPIMSIGGVIYSLAVGLIGCAAYKELINVIYSKRNQCPSLMKYIGLISMLFLIYSNFEKFGLLFGVPYNVICGIILGLLIPVVFYKEKYKIHDAFSLLAYVIFLGIGFNLLLSVYNYNVKYFIFLILITIFTDTFALFGGKLVGKHHFTSISPNKTIEGSLIGSSVATFICTMYYIRIIGNISNIPTIIVMVLFLSLVGQLGDLFFSAIKREYNKKDFSDLIPGHGGILDRLDSILFVVTAFCLIINYI